MRSSPFVVLLGCSPGGPTATTTQAPKAVEPVLAVAPAAPPAPSGLAVATAQALELQLAQGEQLYVDTCAGCHGDAGEGTEDGPPVIGEGALPIQPRPGAKREVTFRTAADVYAFAREAMPADDPGMLAAEQYLAIVAFDVRANGIGLARPLTAATAQLIVLHP